MINPNLCNKCKYGKVSMPHFDEKTGEKLTLWSVDCYVDSEMTYFLFIGDEAPEKCPMFLEHTISMQSIPKEEMKYLTEIDE